MLDSAIDSGVEDNKAKGLRQRVTLCGEPVVFAINLSYRIGVDVFDWFGGKLVVRVPRVKYTLGDAILRSSTGVTRVITVAAFPANDKAEGGVEEAILEGHIEI